MEGWLRTVDVARRAGCSAQQVRKLEAAGVLPPTTRTASGYRLWDDSHVTSLLAYRQMAVAIGPVEARLLLRDAHHDESRVLTRLDAAHAQLHQERRELNLARDAVRSIHAEPLDDIEPADSMSVGALAIALGVRPSTLRHWEAEKLLSPGRSLSGARLYTPTDVRDARVIHQLRQAGHRIAPLRDLLPTLFSDNTADQMLADRDQSIRARSRALLDGTVSLARCLDTPPTSSPTLVP